MDVSRKVAPVDHFLHYKKPQITRKKQRLINTKLWSILQTYTKNTTDIQKDWKRVTIESLLQKKKKNECGL
jgi:hypothetical protein